MFEQHSYIYDTPAEPLREGDLFYNSEVGRWKFDNRIYSIFVGAAVFVFAFIGITAQTPLLTARGCDSPFVGRVCQVLDMAYVGSMLYGTDREFVDAEYERIELGDADVVWIDQTGVPAQMEYPEGYFQIANPEQFSVDQAMLNGSPSTFDSFSSSGFPTTPPIQSGGSLIDTPAIAPKNNPKARPKNLPSSPFDPSDVDADATADNTNGTEKAEGNKASGNSNTSTPPEPKISAEEIAALGGNKFNTGPLKDVAKLVNGLIANKEINLGAGFHFAAKGRLGADGRFRKNTFKYVKAESTDPKMVDVVKRSIEGFNESGFLQVLKDLEGKDLQLELKQDEKSITAIVKSEVERETRASSLKGIFKLGLDLAIKNKENDIAELEKQLEQQNTPEKAAELQRSRDDLALLQATTVAADGKVLTINFAVDKSVVQALIDRKLKEEAAKTAAADVKKQGGSVVQPGSNTAAKR